MNNPIPIMVFTTAKNPLTGFHSYWLGCPQCGQTFASYETCPLHTEHSLIIWEKSARSNLSMEVLVYRKIFRTCHLNFHPNRSHTHCCWVYISRTFQFLLRTYNSRIYKLSIFEGVLFLHQSILKQFHLLVLYLFHYQFRWDGREHIQIL